jgi:hypothetical protein
LKSWRPVRAGPPRITAESEDGNAAEPGSLVCVDLAELQGKMVTLERPLSDREIVDGFAVA